MELPAAAGAVVIGGGVIGCSAAYHLAKMGCRDVAILERRRLTCGTTWHSAGQVRKLRSTRNLTELIRYSARLYASLEAETGQGTGWLECGSISIATNPDRLTHVKRQASLARAFDVDVEVIDAGRVGELWPLMRTDDIIGTVYSPTDGRVNPSDLSLALVKGAKAMGVRVVEGAPVTGFRTQNGRMAGVETGAGTIETSVAVDCAGLWGREVAALAGATAPLHAVEHFYLLTEPMPGIDGHLPVLSDHDGHLYLRDEVGGLLVGCFEPGGKAIATEDLPADFEFDLLNEDWDHFEPMMINAMHRIPDLETARARMLPVGPESFTADGMFLLGEAPETPGFFLCCGMNSGGVALAGGVGKALAEWVTDGRPEKELWHADIRRFPAVMNGLKELRDRAPETMMLHFAVAYPDREHDSARDLLLSPLHGRLAKRGARFEQRMAWERPAWFAAPVSEIDEGLCFGKPPWFGRLAAEHRAAREGVAVFDQTSFGKLRIEGGDAEALLGRLAANDVAVPPGRVVYTGFLNEDGGYESDLTLMRLDGDRYLAVTGSARPVRDADWIRGHMYDGEAAAVTDVREEYAVLGVAGPRSRELLSRLGAADFSNFPYYTCREIEAAGATVLAARLSYAGETGVGALRARDRGWRPLRRADGGR